MNLPRVYENGKFNRILHPISLSLTQNITPLDTASVTLPADEHLAPGSYVEIFTPYGSAGLFRVRSPHDAYGDDTSTAELDHMISEVGDYLVKEELDEMMEADKAFGRIFNHYHGGLWRIGTASALGKDKVAVKASYERVLDALLAILEQKPDCMMTFDFTKTPWRLNVVKRGTTVKAEGRLSRNVKSATISYDDTELCTRVWYKKYNSDSEATWTYKDASTKKKYGVVERTVSTSSDMTSSEITNTVDTYLDEHKEPRVSVSIQASDLSDITGESMDKFVIGNLMRLNIIDKGVTVEKNITSVVWDDLYNSNSVTVTLGDEEDTVVTYLHNLDSSGSGGGGSGGKKKGGDDDKWSEYISKLDVQERYIDATVKKVDKYGKILEAAGLNITAKGVLIYATDNKNQLGSKIKVESDRISLVVEGTGKNAKIKAASIVASINEGKSTIKISADHIVLDGLVTANELNVQKGRIDNLVNGTTLASYIRSNRLAASNEFVMNGHKHNNSVITIGGVNFNIVTWTS